MNANRSQLKSVCPGACQRALVCVLFGLAFALIAGCGTTTKRGATEQLLISTAVDEAIAKIDFSHLAHQKIYLDPTYLRPVRSVGFVNADYVISALRQQLTAAGCLIQDDRELADAVVEARVGALGTDGHEIIYGIPQTGGLSAAASALSNSPIAAIPEISFAQTNSHSGVAKIILFAYDRQTRQPLWQSGVASAESNSINTWVLGAGPFQKGSIYEGPRFAGRKIQAAHSFIRIPVTGYDNPESGSNPHPDGDDISYRNAIAFLPQDKPNKLQQNDELAETNAAVSSQSAEATVAESGSPEQQFR